jgi:hypothetical protein
MRHSAIPAIWMARAAAVSLASTGTIGMLLTSSLVKSRAAPRTPATLGRLAGQLGGELMHLILGLQDRAGHLRQLLAVAPAPGAGQPLPGVPGAVRQPVGHHVFPRAVSHYIGAELSGDPDPLALMGAQTWPIDGTDWRGRRPFR